MHSGRDRKLSSGSIPTSESEVRLATLDDVEVLGRLIERSARALCAADYTPAQIEGALRSALGIDRQLIADGTYFVVEWAGQVAACGGWSLRKTLFGGDAGEGRDAARLEPPDDAARIRAFFVDPSYVRQGLGRLLLERCEAAASARGFVRFELMATRSGERLYARFGYEAAAPITHDLGDGLTIDFVPMSKPASQPYGC